MDGNPPPNPTSVNVLAPEAYATLLHGMGFAEQNVRLQVYPHVLASSGDVVEWVRGTNLTRFFRRLPDEMHEPFVDAYREALLDRIGEHSPYFYAFKRILMWGRVQG
jgi:trans-aconitate 2-methyltransferase